VLRDAGQISSITTPPKLSSVSNPETKRSPGDQGAFSKAVELVEFMQPDGDQQDDIHRAGTLAMAAVVGLGRILLRSSAPPG
jgi:hypothetical protein